ncbi:MAG: mannose-1-phosphate guanylyltransferase [Demequinaceae bacterium]|nr:mannose-1-phosphate guanylyltransferase [Demequinaceae bacterium]
MSPDAGFSAVIPAGGVGSRLWPLSTPDHPKFLLDLLGSGASLLQDTVARVAPVSDRIMIVTGAAHVSSVRGQLPCLGDDDVIAEPSPHDSMPAIALAAAVLERRHGPHSMGAFSADHVIRKPEAFREAVRIARAAAEAGKVVVIGIEPRGPSTAFGYIKAEAPIEGMEGVRQVEAFTEKPDASTAEAMLAAGSHYWNAGMYVTRTDVLLGHLSRTHPSLEQGVRELAEAWDGPRRAAELDRIWPDLTCIAIDHAIAEPVAAEGGVAVVPGDLDWYDIGDFAVLASMMEPGPDGVRLLQREAGVTTIDAPGAMVVGGERPVVLVGVGDVTVVDAPDAILVLGRDSAQKVKQAMEGTRKR